MNYCLIVFSSFASANRVKNLLLKKHAVNSDIIQTPAEVKAKGCGYSLKLKLKDTDVAWNIVRQNSLSSKGVFSYENYTRLK